MQIDQSNRSFAIHPIFLAISVGIHVLIVQGIVVYSRLHPTTPPPAITEIIEVAMFELPAPAAAGRAFPTCSVICICPLVPNI